MAERLYFIDKNEKFFYCGQKSDMTTSTPNLKCSCGEWYFMDEVD